LVYPCSWPASPVCLDPWIQIEQIRPIFFPVAKSTNKLKVQQPTIENTLRASSIVAIKLSIANNQLQLK
jgi:hypothetical protein